MLAAWTELMPLFVVRWLARRHCEKFHLGSYQLHGARPGIFVMASQSAQAQKDQT